MSAAFKQRLVWLLLALTLYQAWGAVRHVHGVEAMRALAAVSLPAAAERIDGAASAPTVAAAESESPDNEPRDEAHCDCLWCAPRLHLLLAHALPIPEPPAGIASLQRLAAAPGSAFSSNPRGTVPPPRGPPV